jgi:hypothetical protein
MIFRVKVASGSLGTDLLIRDFVSGIEFAPFEWKLSWQRLLRCEFMLAIGPIYIYSLRRSTVTIFGKGQLTATACQPAVTFFRPAKPPSP